MRSNSNALVRRNMNGSRITSPFSIVGPVGLFSDGFDSFPLLGSAVSGSPFQMVRRMQEDMDRLFSQVLSGSGNVSAPLSSAGLIAPSVDVSETGTEYRIDVELPGIPQDAIDIRVVEGTISIHAEINSERNTPEESTSSDQTRQYHYRERRWGRYERTFHLPPNADEDNVRAEFRDGILTLTVPKKEQRPEERNGRRIPIAAVDNVSDGKQLTGMNGAKTKEESSSMAAASS